KSGRQYKQPLSYVRDGDTLLTPGGGRWKLNLVEGRPEHVRLRGRDVSLSPELVHDPVEVERLLSVMSATNRMVQRFTGLPKGRHGHYDHATLDLTSEHGFRIVRRHPKDKAAKETMNIR